MNDLFDFESSSGNIQKQAPYQPLADRMRPTRIEDILGQEHILGEGRPLRILLEAGLSGSIIFWGPPGCGKTTLARVMAQTSDAEFVQLSAVTSGVKDLKQVFERAANLRRSNGRKTVLFVDEIHRFNKAQQDALLPHIESGTVVFIGATTENPSFEVVSALLSRCQVLTLKSVAEDALISIMLRALDIDNDLKRNPQVDVAEDALARIALMAAGDARIALNVLETCCEIARQQNPFQPSVNAQLVAESFQSKSLRYDKGGEEHYNLISALHKSMRGSDPDASLYWLYRMIEGGEDCRFILRRMIRFASEDVGMADPFALTLAMSAAQAFDYVGPPEGHLFLAQLAVYLAAAPKSNSIYTAEAVVKKTIREGNEPGVPFHIRNAPTGMMKELGYGRRYKYPHDYANGFVHETYLPEEIEGQRFYTPKKIGKEKIAAERLKLFWPERYDKK
ncbi:MAG: putative ATPase [Clostridiales bacterium]|jgi:putative ATPase|nr:putative ATPase [Clostridiales bacterium]MDN5280988.1 putative ATPase [Candidatus Ozemobacter sp.]